MGRSDNTIEFEDEVNMESELDKETANFYSELSNGLKRISEYKAWELDAEAFLSKDKYIRPYLIERAKKKKHLKRKHAKEILMGIKYVSGAVNEKNKIRNLLRLKLLR